MEEATEVEKKGERESRCGVASNVVEERIQGEGNYYPLSLGLTIPPVNTYQGKKDHKVVQKYRMISLIAFHHLW